jgi:8-oxo-dGTP pyrophosphatase MutT (NUDIX family)
MDLAPNSDSFPRPVGAVQGEQAPWAHLSEEQRSGFELDQVLERLLSAKFPDHPDPLPWAEGEDLTNLPQALAAHSLRDAAVLVAFYEEAGDVHVVLTRRSENLRSHSGQVAFPGGRIDAGESAIQAALREAYEEVDLDPEVVEVLGLGQKVAIMGGGSMVQPVFARLSRPPRLLASPDEVTEIFHVPLSALLRSGAYREDRWPGGGMGSWMPDGSMFRICFLNFDGTNTVWGVTGWMLRGYLCDILGIDRI